MLKWLLRVADHVGRVYLKIVVDAKAVLFLLGSIVDFETTMLHEKFVFRNPNQTDACGCGESVTIAPAT